MDRDDTLIENAALPWERIGTRRGDLCDPAWVRLLPRVREACASLVSAGFPLVVVTNQGVVARGGGTIADVERTNDRMLELLTVGGKRLIERVYFCPFHPEGTVAAFAQEHPWRKPAPGMILDAARELGLDIGRSWMVGDGQRDIEAGLAAGIVPERALLIGRGRAIAGLDAAARVILASGAARA